jgi:sodium-dependent phosphate cotransporter
LEVNSKLGRLNARSILSILAVVIIFLAAINMMSVAFSKLGSEAAQSILSATSNPFIGLFIGLLMTAIIQSSSTSTTMTVAAVASGSIAFENAIPIIMGANIGTTLTSTLVALSYITKKKEFERAIAAGVSHDLFNLFTVILLFPLEYYFDFLSKSSRFIAGLMFTHSEATSNGNFGGLATHVFEPLSTFIYNLSGGSSIVLLIIAFVLILGSIKLLSNFLYDNIAMQIESNVDNAIIPSRIRSFAIGTLSTAVVQSSSLTTSFIVPVVATGRITLKNAFHFIIGANIGTTITALVAAAFRTEATVSIAMVHLLFNLCGCILFLPSYFPQNWLLAVSRYLGKATSERRIIGFLYILLIFFIIPFTLIYFNRTV